MEPLADDYNAVENTRESQYDGRILNPEFLFTAMVIAVVAYLLLILPFRWLSPAGRSLYNCIGIPIVYVVSAWVLGKKTGTWSEIRLLSPQLNMRVFSTFFALFWLFQLAFRTLGLVLFPPDLRPYVSGVNLRWPEANASFIRSVVGSPIGEEMFFRGWLLSWLKQLDNGYLFKGKLSRANLVASLIFTILHFPGNVWGSLVGIFIISVLMGAARERSDSLALPMFLHFMANFVECVIW